MNDLQKTHKEDVDQALGEACAATSGPILQESQKIYKE